MEYKKFPIEFVERTKHLLEFYKGDYEVTNLINCLLGLIILPFEVVPSEHRIEFWNRMSLEEIKNKAQYELLAGSEDSIRNTYTLVRLIRNAFAHASIGTISIEGEIESVVILEHTRTNSQNRVEIRFSIQGLKELALIIADHYLCENKKAGSV
jgi:hypothetical protein